MNQHLLDLRIKLDQAITYGTHQEAVAVATGALEKALKDDLPGEIEYFKGQLALLAEDFPGAIKHFDEAIRHNPDDGAAFNDRALCMVEIGSIDGALEYFDKGIYVEPDYATIYHNKGWLLNNIGRHKEAIGCFNKALELEPARAVTYDNLADALFNLGDLQGAIDAYKKVLVFLPVGCCAEIKQEVNLRIKELEQGRL